MKGRILFRGFPTERKGFRNLRQRQKVEIGECARHSCNNATLTCERCHTWWKLDTPERKASYRSEDPKCPFCDHKPIIHSFYCKEHRYICRECELDHPRPGCPYRDLRDGKALCPEHEKWFRDRINSLKGRELLFALFGNGRDRVTRKTIKDSRDWKLLQHMAKRQLQDYADWESDETIRRRKLSECTTAGIAKARAAGGNHGRPRKKS